MQKQILCIFLVQLLLISLPLGAHARVVETTWGGDSEMVYDTGFMHMLMKHPDGGVCLFNMDLIQNESALSPEEDVVAKTINEQLNEVLGTLLPREAEILRLRFGLGDGTSHTLEQLGRIFGITRERVRQIEKKALMKLRHPKRSLRLRDFVE